MQQLFKLGRALVVVMAALVAMPPRQVQFAVRYSFQGSGSRAAFQSAARLLPSESTGR